MIDLLERAEAMAEAMEGTAERGNKMILPPRALSETAALIRELIAQVKAGDV
jgi:hypothetical protein